MLVLYFKNEKASFQEQRFSLQVILSKHLYCSKAKINKTTLLSQTFPVVLTYVILISSQVLVSSYTVGNGPREIFQGNILSRFWEPILTIFRTQNCLPWILWERPQMFKTRKKVSTPKEKM